MVRGVLRQALREARVTHARFVGSERRQQELVRRWCDVAVADNDTQRSILVSAAHKTELLLGCVARADVYPLGDLYATDLQDFCGAFEVGERVQRLAEAAGGMKALDQGLRAWLEERRDAPDAFAHIPQVRDDVFRLLEQSRFQRMHLGIVPKIGARTIGIDLFI